MHSEYTVPRLAGNFQGGTEAGSPSSVLAGVDATAPYHIEYTGTWRPEELHVVEHPLGEVALYGVCLADAETVRRRAARALESGDHASLTQLPGNYTTLVVQPHQLTAFADLVGRSPLFYTKGNDGIQFASLIAPLEATDSQPDPLSFAARLAAPWTADLLGDRSPVTGIQHLEPGQALRVTGGGDVYTNTYESFPARFGFDEGAVALREALVEAVRLRMQLGYRLSADFSGGLDSTSVAFLAAREMDEPLMIATRYARDASLDDLNHARWYRQLRESQGRFAAHEFPYDAGEFHYVQLLEAPVGDEPDISILGWALNATYFDFLKERGSELHFSGSGADAVVDMDARSYIGGLARLGTYGRFLRSCIEAARVERGSPRQLMADALQAQHWRPATALRDMAQFLLTDAPTVQRADIARIFGSGSVPQWLTPRMRRELSEFAASRADELTLPAEMDVGNYQAYAGIRGLGPAYRNFTRRAAAHGVYRHDPFMDSAVLRACFGVPSHERMNPWEFKAMLGRALGGLVPDIVLQRTTKGNYVRHAFQSLRAAAPVLSQLIRHSYLADMGVVDPGRVQATVERAYAGGDVAWAALDTFFAAELWLRKRYGGQPLPAALHPAISSSPIVSPTRKAPEVLPPVSPLPDTKRYGMSPGVFMVTRPHSTMAMNTQTGKYSRLNNPALEVMRALSKAETLGEALAEIADAHPDITAMAIRTKTHDLIRNLVKRGLLQEGSKSFSIIAGIEQSEEPPASMARQAEAHAQLRIRDYVSAVGGFALSLHMQRLPFDRQVRSMIWLRERLGRQPASAVEAERNYAAVRRVSAYYFGRVACLEMARAAVLTTFLRGRDADFVIGIRTDPDSFHAWPEAAGVPIRTAADEPIVNVYQSIFRV